MRASDNDDLLNLKEQIIKTIMTASFDLEDNAIEAFKFYINAANASGDVGLYRKALEVAEHADDNKERVVLLTELLAAVSEEISMFDNDINVAEQADEEHLDNNKS